MMRWWIVLVLLVVACCAFFFLLWTINGGSNDSLIIGQEGRSTQTEAPSSDLGVSNTSDEPGEGEDAQAEPGSATIEDLEIWTDCFVDRSLDESVRLESLRYLAQASRLGRESELGAVLKERKIHEDLIAFLRYGKGEVGLDALELMGCARGDEVPPEVFDFFSEESRDPSSYALRAAAVRAAGSFEHIEAKAIRALNDRLDDASIRVVVAAIRTLPRIKADGHDGIASIAPSLLNSRRSSAQKAALEEMEALAPEQTASLSAARKELKALAETTSSGREAEEQLELASRARALLQRLDSLEE